MARAPDVVQFQCVMSPELRNALDRAAVDMRIPAGETAGLDRGEMSRRLFRWFLSRSMAERHSILAEAIGMPDVPSPRDDPAPSKITIKAAGGSITDVKSNRKRPDKLNGPAGK